MMNVKWPAALLCALGATWWTLAANATEPVQVAQAASGVYAEGGTKTCLGCHDQAPANLILQGPMAVMGDSRTPMAQQGCETPATTIDCAPFSLSQRTQAAISSTASSCR